MGTGGLPGDSESLSRRDHSKSSQSYPTWVTSRERFQLEEEVDRQQANEAAPTKQQQAARSAGSRETAIELPEHEREREPARQEVAERCAGEHAVASAGRGVQEQDRRQAQRHQTEPVVGARQRVQTGPRI